MTRKKTKETRLKEFNPKTQDALAYGNFIVSYAPRSYAGHEVVSILASLGLDPNNFFNEDGTIKAILKKKLSKGLKNLGKPKKTGKQDKNISKHSKTQKSGKR